MNSTPQFKEKRGIPPIAIIGILFFIFGFITWLNSVLIPYLRIAYIFFRCLIYARLYFGILHRPAWTFKFVNVACPMAFSVSRTWPVY